jgi:hypothetical protein
MLPRRGLDVDRYVRTPSNVDTNGVTWGVVPDTARFWAAAGWFKRTIGPRAAAPSGVLQASSDGKRPHRFPASADGEVGMRSEQTAGGAVSLFFGGAWRSEDRPFTRHLRPRASVHSLSRSGEAGFEQILRRPSGQYRTTLKADDAGA